MKYDYPNKLNLRASALKVHLVHLSAQNKVRLRLLLK
jgi:hypothetical protein